jgi:hypothetical protein
VIQLACGVAEGRLQIVRLKIRHLGKDLIGGQPSGIKVEHIAYWDPHASDAGLAAALGWVVGDAGIIHGFKLAASATLKPPTPSPAATLPALLWLSLWNREGPRARSWARVEGEKRASLLRRLMNSRSVSAPSRLHRLP